MSSTAKPTILAIDDADNVRRLIEMTLGKSHTVKTTADGKAALAWAQHAPIPDLVLIDSDIAGASGYDFCRELRGISGWGKVPVAFLAEHREAAHLVEAFELGAVDYILKPLAAPTLLQRIRAHLVHLARERDANIHGTEQEVARLLRAIQAHDRSLAGKRAVRLSEYARALAQAAGARDVACQLLAKAAPLIDVGKLGVAPAILRKAENALTPPEREEFERHPSLGGEIMGEGDDALLKLARTVALTYRERWDGTGFPGRLQGSQIPWSGRVMAIVDAFEKISAPQHSEAAMSLDEALIEQAAGKQFDPGLMPALRKALPALRKIHEQHAEQSDPDEDIVIGTAPPAAAKAAPAAPVKEADADLTMLGPLPVGKAGARSPDKVREAMQRAAAKAQAARRAKEEAPAAAHAPAAEPPPPAADKTQPLPDKKPPAVDLDLSAVTANEPPTAAADKVREAMQRAAAKAQAARRAKEEAPAPAPVEEPAAPGADKTQPLPEKKAPAIQRAATEKALDIDVDLPLDAPAAEAPPAPADKHALEEAPTITLDLSAQAAAPLEAPAKDQPRPAVLAAVKVAQDALAQAQSERAAADAALAEARESSAELEVLRVRVTELEAERTALEEAATQARVERQAFEEAMLKEIEQAQLTRAEVESLRTRVQGLQTEQAAAQAALVRAQAALDAARAETTELRSKLLAAQQAQASGADEALAELEALRARALELEAAHRVVQSALSQAQLDVGRARADAEALRVRVRELQTAQPAPAEQPQSHAEVERLLARVKELDGERAGARRELEALRSRLSEVESEHASAQARLAQALAQAEDMRARAEQLETERSAAAGATTVLTELEERRQRAEAALAELEARAREAQAALYTERERAHIAAEREASETRAEEAARRRESEERAAAHAAEDRRRAEESLAVVAEARAAAERELAEAAERRVALEGAATAAPAAAEPALRERRSLAAMVFAFLFGALCAAVAYLYFFGPAPEPERIPEPPRVEPPAVLNGAPVPLKREEHLTVPSPAK